MADDPDRHMRQASAGNSPFEGAPSFSLQHRLHRAAWQIAWTLLASWTPAPLHRWRIFLANLFGAQIDRSCFLYGSVRIWYPPNLTMERRSTLGREVDCYCMAPIALGEDAVVSQRAFLCTGMHDLHGGQFQIRAKSITIGARAWICAEAFVGPGVTVGEGAVLAARGAAFEELADWTIYRGNPAQAKGSRGRPKA